MFQKSTLTYQYFILVAEIEFSPPPRESAQEVPGMRLYKTPHYVLSVESFGSDQCTVIIVIPAKDVSSLYVLGPATLSSDMMALKCVFLRLRTAKDPSASEDPTSDTYVIMTSLGTLWVARLALIGPSK